MTAQNRPVNENRRDDLTVPEIVAKLNERLDSLVRELLPKGRRDGREWRDARKAQGGMGESLAMCLAGPKRGIWVHSAAATGGDALDLIAYVLNLSKRDSVRWALDWLGLSRGEVRPADPAPRRQDESSEVDLESRLKRAERVWDGVRPIAGTPAETYLRIARGIDLPLTWPTLGFHPACEYWWKPEGAKRYELLGRFPALVAMVEGVNGDFLGVWRIYLSDDGLAKAKVPDPKLGVGVVRGGGVRLGPPSEITIIAEGLESTASAIELSGGLAPGIAALSTSGLVGLELPEIVEVPIIFADNDPPVLNKDGTYRLKNGRRIYPGLDAARSAAERWKAEGRRPVIELSALPDANDVLRARKGLWKAAA